MGSKSLYRQCVGIALFNKSGKVFVGERIDTPGAWQFPQGGIDEGEDLEKAAFRELAEEIGTNKASILKIMDDKTRYDLPADLQQKLWGGKYKGQEQNWIAMRFEGSDEDIKIDADDHPEFSQWQWIDIEKALNLIVPFKRDTYLKVIKQFKEFS
ncbi:MAG: RNA pyrophosphohydrolase [Pseudomonadota bacterium]